MRKTLLEKESPYKMRLNKLKLVNFKCFDEIEIEFPKPFNKEDLDVFVLGSQNGLGKTSVLEACSLLFLGLFFGKEAVYFKNKKFIDYFIKSGKSNCIIEGFFEIENRIHEIKLNFKEHINGVYEYGCVTDTFFENFFKAQGLSNIDHFLEYLSSSKDEPFILPPFIYFNSNRKINAKNVKFEDISKDDEYSLFKKEVMKILAAKGDIYEDFSVEDSEESLKFLNNLCKDYAQCSFGKINSVSGDIKITLTSGDVISLDGLSSGQKEIISTLFLIWKNTKDQPGIILIDEPELHLNAEWQHKFIRNLEKLPDINKNQYIFATHSKHIFGSVEPEYRGLIRPDICNLSEE